MVVGPCTKRIQKVSELGEQFQIIPEFQSRNVNAFKKSNARIDTCYLKKQNKTIKKPTIFWKKNTNNKHERGQFSIPLQRKFIDILYENIVEGLSLVWTVHKNSGFFVLSTWKTILMYAIYTRSGNKYAINCKERKQFCFPIRDIILCFYLYLKHMFNPSFEQKVNTP